MTAYDRYKSQLTQELEQIKKSGLYKSEKAIVSSQSSDISTNLGEMINFCANNYLGLANSQELIDSAKNAVDTHGFGVASVRFICGTQDIHLELENKISKFMDTEATILYTSCFDANTGLFETLLGPDDAIISDELNHASIIDGIRLCKATRKVYKHADLEDLESRLKETVDSRFKMIATDGVFSMQGDIAPLEGICDLAEKYDALVMVDDSHATGFFGPNGRGTADELGVQNRIDITTSTLGKALGGASGGFTTGKKEIIEFLRQRSRPYLFSNSLAPAVVMGSMKAFDLIDQKPELRDKLRENTTYFRKEMTNLGFDIIPGNHPIVPVMIGDEIKNVELAKAVNDEGIFCVGFSFPVVPKGQARIRLQMSAAHNRTQLDKAIVAFQKAGKNLKII
ncbi:MAG: glycine C-acetyltransferase [SAR202 cluster bacterium]|nr:glycine C-acetyltransferase [SAR202 cluster bacterium]|tara:strand:+ start:2685 stop:3875 length:1191 start_codon:yes stop_codon:yes gene_type:complete